MCEPLSTEVLIETLRNHVSENIVIKNSVLTNVAGRLEIYRKAIGSLKSENAELNEYIEKKVAQLQAKLQALEHQAKLITPDQNKLKSLETELEFRRLTESNRNKQLEAENKELKTKTAKDFNEAAEILLKSIKNKYQVDLDKHRWIPADEPPENLRNNPTETEWKTWYETLDYEDKIPKFMQAEQIWLNESSEVEYYRPIILPEQALESEGKK